jgi:transposase-like protein
MLSELSKRYEIHPNLITQWKKSFIENGFSLFKETQKNAIGNVHTKVWTIYLREYATTRIRMWLKARICHRNVAKA